MPVNFNKETYVYVSFSLEIFLYNVHVLNEDTIVSHVQMLLYILVLGTLKNGYLMCLYTSPRLKNFIFSDTFYGLVIIRSRQASLNVQSKLC